MKQIFSFLGDVFVSDGFNPEILPESILILINFDLIGILTYFYG